MENWKKFLPDVLAVVLFALISFAYFFPADIEGKILYRHDSAASKGLGREMAEHKEKTGEVTRWMNSVFSGMPTYQTAPEYTSAKPLGEAINIYHLFLPENVWFVFAYLLGFYILLRAFDFRQHLAVLGSIIWAFSSYFFIIIAAGHLWKVMALAYLPPMIGGVVLAYRGKYLAGLIVTAIFTAFEVNANHVQMTYYYLFIILFMVIAFLADAIREKKLAHFGKATAICAAGAVIGICLNLSNLYHTWEYSKESMRGKSELVKKESANQTASGLDRDYITQWSYGIDETWTLLVPNTKGGASAPLVNSDKAMEHADNQFMPVYQQLGQYWGDQPGTMGPVYVGAFVLMLFVLGLFIVKGGIKWALLAATVLSILLSWGKNFMPFTNFFIDYVPMYAKFRTVASILVIAEFTIPLLAMLGADSQTAPATAAYLRWTTTFGAAPAILNVVLAYLVRSEGAAIHASVGTMSGCLLNILLDPFFILPWGLNMGAEGAGLATFVSNCVACLYFFVLLFIRRGNTYVCIRPSALRPKREIVLGVCGVGIPASIQNLLNVTGMTILNNFTAAYGADAVAAMGIAQKVNMVPLYISLGLSQGIMPLVSYSYASGNGRRMKQTVTFSAKTALSFILALCLCYYLFAAQLTRLFINQQAIVDYGARFLRGLCLGLPFLCMDFLAVGVFQAVGMGREALGFAITRKIILEIPALYILNALFPLYGLAYAQLAAEVILSVLAVLVLSRLFKRLQQGEGGAGHSQDSP